jgi:hypothetical protein
LIAGENTTITEVSNSGKIPVEIPVPGHFLGIWASERPALKFQASLFSDIFQ